MAAQNSNNNENNTGINTNGIKNSINVLPYVTQGSSNFSSAPSNFDIGFTSNTPRIENISPIIINKYINIEKYLLAFSLSPSPIVLETSAHPPVPNINPTVPKIISAGIIKFTAANPSEPTMFDTNIPSTTP